MSIVSWVEYLEVSWISLSRVQYSWVILSWDKESISSRLLAWACAYLFKFPLHARTFYVCHILSCIFSWCRYKYLGSSANISLRSCGIPVSYGKPSYNLEEFTFTLQLVVLRYCGFSWPRVTPRCNSAYSTPKGSHTIP